MFADLRFTYLYDKVPPDKRLYIGTVRGDLDVLVECVDEEKNNSSSAPYQCKLGTKYISQTAPIV